MSTDYPIHDDSKVELFLGEHSCLFDVIVNEKAKPDWPFPVASNLTPEQLFDMGISILRTSSYYCDEQKPSSFEAKVIEALRKNG